MHRLQKWPLWEPLMPEWQPATRAATTITTTNTLTIFLSLRLAPPHHGQVMTHNSLHHWPSPSSCHIDFSLYAILVVHYISILRSQLASTSADTLSNLCFIHCTSSIYSSTEGVLDFWEQNTRVSASWAKETLSMCIVYFIFH